MEVSEGKEVIRAGLNPIRLMSLQGEEIRTQTRGEDHLEPQGDKPVYKPRRGPTGSQPCHSSSLGFQPPELRENELWLLTPPKLWYFVREAPANWRTGVGASLLVHEVSFPRVFQAVNTYLTFILISTATSSKIPRFPSVLACASH